MAEAKQDVSEKAKSQTSDAKKLYIVGIGASAGGLEAINAFFEQVPVKSGLSFVLIQHLSPDYKSMMPELLTKHTSLKISKVTDATTVEPNTIYTIPADKNITISGGKLYLEDRGNPKTLNLPINIFFRHLAEDQRERAVGVVLSGTGSDATLGIEAIKQYGGMVIAQTPNSAAFDSMPKSAIATGLVDFILHPTRMPETIVNFVKNPYVQSESEAEQEESDHTDSIFRILTLLHRKTNMDFRQYKQSTVVRRIDRRMGIHNISNHDTYWRFLKEDNEELDQLSADMLIGVTSFFRDKQAFEHLEKNVIEALVRDHSLDRELRLWVVGCSIGKEAYSMGILLKEACRTLKKHVAVKIFATDIDQRAIDTASRGIFPESIEEEIPKGYLNRYFIHQNNTYQVKKELREMAIFAKHDITKDPPFNNIDLASCRNLLIYIEPELQEKILSYIHFSLTDKGFLFLGSSENLGNYHKVFDVLSKKYKIFRNRSSVRIVDINKLYPFDHKKKLANRQEKPEEQYGVPSETKIINNFKDALLEDLVPPTIIINEGNDVVHVAGEVERFIKLPKKQLTLNVLKMVDEQFYVTLSNIISKARNQKGKVESPLIKLHQGSDAAVKVVGKHYMEPTSRLSYCIISFIDSEISSRPLLENGVSEETESNRQVDNERNAHIRQLEEDLKETKEYLQATIEELETSNEELQATNEELMAANEELQSSNEELQSVNEELFTVNSEFQDKIQEMTELNDDLNNFIQNTHIPTLFLDIDYTIRRFTQETTSYIKITSNDVGRYIGDFNHTFISFDLTSVAKKVVDTFLPVEQRVETSKNEVFLVRASPYKTSKKEVKGVVFTFVEVTELRKIEDELIGKAKELERSNLELEQFAYVASHDLKAPISNLVALLNILETRDGIQANCLPIFEKVSESVERMNRTIRTLNEVITIKKNLDLEPDELSLNEVLKSVLSFIDDQVENANATINTNFEDGETVYFPEIHLRSILQNLITNAIKYRKENTPPVIDIESHLEDGQFSLWVTDNGRGINMKEYGKKLFGLFQRFHLDTEGKGIGLHIVKSIIEKYGGRIEVESKMNKGTTFKIYFAE